MFASECIALFVFFSMKKTDEIGFDARFREAVDKGKQLEFSSFIFAVPALVDLISSNLRYAGLNFVSASIAQMVRGGTIITTLLFSILLLRRKPIKQQKVGCLFAVVGLLLLGISAFISEQENKDKTSQNQIIGYFLLIASLFANGFLYSYQERLLSKYHIEPLQMVGYQGIFGLSFSIVLVVIFSFVPCSFGQNACVILDDGKSVIEQPLVYLRQVSQKPSLLLFVIISIFGSSAYNIIGVTVTRHIGAVSRSMNHISSSLLVWIVGLVLTLTFGEQDPDYKWENTEFKVIITLILGFILLIFGNLVYHKIVILPLMKIKKNEISDKAESYRKIECITSNNTQEN